jgi:hypothetical protein
LRTAPVSSLAASVRVERAWSNEGAFLLLRRRRRTRRGLVPFLTRTTMRGRATTARLLRWCATRRPPPPPSLAHESRLSDLAGFSRWSPRTTPPPSRKEYTLYNRFVGSVNIHIFLFFNLTLNTKLPKDIKNSTITGNHLVRLHRNNTISINTIYFAQLKYHQENADLYQIKYSNYISKID